MTWYEWLSAAGSALLGFLLCVVTVAAISEPDIPSYWSMRRVLLTGGFLLVLAALGVLFVVAAGFMVSRP